MFNSLIASSCNSQATAGNRITDGSLELEYRGLPAVFERIDDYLGRRQVPPQSCLAFHCSNNVCGAVFLLWALHRGRKILLTPPAAGPVQADDKGPDAPQFCQHLVAIEFTSEQADLLEPASYLRIDANPAFREESVIATARPTVFLKTSGSMASPKLVMHDAENLAANVTPCIERFGITKDDRISVPVPIFHMYGLGAGFLPAVIAGASIDIQQNTNLIRLLDREREFEPTRAFLTPGLCEMFIKARRGSRLYDLVVTAGDRISEANYLRFEKAFGKLINLYGSTELGAVATSDPDQPLAARARGLLKPMDGVATRIVETAAEMHAEPGSGEIHFDSNSGFTGYFDASGAAVGQPGGAGNWFPSKDIAVPAADGYFRIIGRCDNSVNRSGRLLPLAEVETAMEKMDGVNRVIVVPHGEDKRGKGMVAFCIPEKTNSLQVEDIKQHCFARLPGYAIPDRILVINAPPRLANGKIDMQGLTDNFIPRNEQELEKT